MSTTLLPPSTPTGTDGGGPGGPYRPAPPDDYGGRRPPRRWPGRRALAGLLASSALLGGAVGAGVLALSGAVGGTSTTTVVQPAAGGTSASATSGLNTTALYASASPGVVDITASGISSPAQQGPFGQGGSSSSTATGSGFVVDSKGDIVTAAHVVDGASSLKVTFADGTTRTATLLGKDDATDMAVLKVDPTGLTLHPLTLGSSASLKVGDAVLAIGSPFGYQESLSTGVVSGLDRTIQAPNGFTIAHSVQTDAAINPGNSGGPILDSSGRVIGIADQIATNGSADQSSGVGFAVPSDLISAELTKLEAGQTVQHAFLGVATSDSTGTSGAAVSSVNSGSPAAGAGIKAGDVITAVDGKAITGSGGLVAAIAGHNPGDSLKLTIHRGSSTLTKSVTLATQPASSSAGG
jgi:putative serine protease PepD